jgi:hypothetical protein
MPNNIGCCLGIHDHGCDRRNAAGARVQALAANVTTINMYGTTETQRGVCGSHANAALHACCLTLSGNAGAVPCALLIYRAKFSTSQVTLY